MKRLFFILSFLVINHVSGQINQELVHFQSANPFSLSDIINDLDKLEKQNVFGKLTIPLDKSLVPLIKNTFKDEEAIMLHLKMVKGDRSQYEPDF